MADHPTASIIISMHHVVKVGFLVFFLSAPAHGKVCSDPVHLTFDVGNMSTSDYVAQVLKEKNIRARFFLANNPTSSGSNALTQHWGRYWQTRVNEGHEFGNHTWSHYFVRSDIGNDRIKAYSQNGSLVRLNKQSYCQELKKVKNTFYRLTKHNIDNVWRAPAGRTTQNSIRWATECGYPEHMGWSSAGYIRDDLPSEQLSNEDLLEKAVSTVKPGDIILMHLGTWKRKIQAAKILPRLVDELRARGMCFTPLIAE